MNYGLSKNYVLSGLNSSQTQCTWTKIDTIKSIENAIQNLVNT